MFLSCPADGETPDKVGKWAPSSYPQLWERKDADADRQE